MAALRRSWPVARLLAFAKSGMEPCQPLTLTSAASKRPPPPAEFSFTPSAAPSHEACCAVGASLDGEGAPNLPKILPSTFLRISRSGWVSSPATRPGRISPSNSGAWMASHVSSKGILASWHRCLHTVSRDSRFASLESSDIAEFKRILGDAGVVQDEDQLQVANTDWMGKFKGRSKLLLLPRSTDQVSQILHHCNSRRLAVVPQGGNTGLVGGSVPVFDEVILSTRKMSAILDFDEVSGILICEAGCVLENLDNFVASKGFCMPLDLGAKGSCQIGGNVATNAGGLRLLRYGSLHGSVLGLEAVLADGSVLNLLKSLRKDNTGYDLKQLLIGSEGTLGVITKVAVLTPPRSPSVHVAFFACASFKKLLEAFRAARAHLGEILSAFELLDRASLDMVLRHGEGAKDPLPGVEAPFYFLVETSGSDPTHDKEKMERFLEQAMEGELVLDGTVAQDSSQAAALWRLREGVAESLQRAGAVYKYDLSIPVEHLYDLVTEMRQRLEGVDATAVGYGHVGDGNLHLNISAKEYSEQVVERIEPFVYEWTSQRRGSISAEHGLGFMKAHAMPYSQTPESIFLMKRVKSLLDPQGILNPYKVFPPSST